MKGFIAVLAVSMVVLNFIINKYNFLPLLSSALSPVITGFLIAYLVEPMVKFIIRISKGKIKRGWAVLITVILIIGFIFVFLAVMVPSIGSSVVDIVDKIQYYFKYQFNIQFFEDLFNRVDSSIMDEVVKYANDMADSFMVKVGEWSSNLLNGAFTIAYNTSTGILNFLMAFVIAVYMLLDKDDLLRKLKRLNYAVNDEQTADRFLYIVHKSHEIFSQFFVGKIIDSAIIGALCFIIMWIFRIPNAPAIGFIIGITNIIPYFGPFIGAVPALLVTLASGSLFQVLLVLIIIIALQQFDGLYLGPKILGKKVGVGAFWIIVSVTVGGALFGLIGMFVGVPVTVLGKTLIEAFVDRKLKEKKLDI